MKKTIIIVFTAFITLAGILFPAVVEFKIVQIIPGKVFTPNGDGVNDVFVIQYSNPQDIPAEGKIYSMSGALVAAMERDSLQERFAWDGKNSSGGKAPSGIYYYQITVNSVPIKKINGICFSAGD